MRVEIKIPTMGESVSQATVSAILKPSGSSVKSQEEILELETDKVNQVLYAPQAGRLTLSVNVHDLVKIGQVIGYVDTDATGSVSEIGSPPTPPAAPVSSGPSVRKMAPEFVAELKPKANRRKMSTLRKVIAQRLVEVKNNTAMLTTFNEVDLSKVMEVRAKEQELFQKKFGVKLGFMSFFVKATASALKAIPEVNAYLDGDEIVTHQTCDIGVAVSTDRGLIVPVLRECETLSFGQLEQAIDAFAQKARGGTISIDDLRGGGFTITNGGVFGSLLSTPILNPPQSAILGMHAIQKRPVAIDDQVVIRPMMYLALSYDHRLIDGKEAVQFLVQIKKSLEDVAWMTPLTS